MARVKKTTATKKAKTISKAAGKASRGATGPVGKKAAGGGGRRKSVKDHKSMAFHWCRILEKNQTASKGRRLTDKQIQHEMKQHFPESSAKQLMQKGGVVSLRWHYNNGGFHGGKVPKVQSQSFDESGEVMVSVRKGGGATPKPKKPTSKRVAKVPTARAAKTVKKAKRRGARVRAK